VPFLDLGAQLAPIEEEIMEAIRGVMASTAFAQGPATLTFEEEFAAFCQTQQCVTVNSGTSALHLAMRCLDIGPGDEVVTVSMSFIATAWPILYLGARPVFVDIDPRRYTMDPAKLEAAVTARTKAIVPVHLYGQCADMNPILEIAAAHGVPVIEDAAQAHGAEYGGRRAGSMGAMACFSFYAGKNLGACGEGGALVTDDPDLANRARQLRDHGQPQKYVHSELGYNYRMDGIQGAVLSVKLKYLEDWTKRRGAVARHYDALLSDCPVETPAPCPDGQHAYHLYVVRCSDRDALQRHLRSHDVHSGLHYPIPIHLQAPFERFGFEKGSLPVTEEVSATCLSLPMFAELDSDQTRWVTKAIRCSEVSPDT
jgi:dTDP-4-amino-4,6-dideoxygalactose transaminase